MTNRTGNPISDLLIICGQVDVVGDQELPGADHRRTSRSQLRRATIRFALGIHFDFLINNVGFGNKKRFFDDSYENQRAMIETHIEAFCKITHFVAGGMRDSKNGKIINVSSLAAFSPTSFNHLYSSTKAFIITFSESLHVELSPLGINVQALCPGFTRSDFHRDLNVKNEIFKNRGLIRWMGADEVAGLSLKNVNKNGGLYVPGWSNKILYIIVKLLPRKYYYYIARKMKM